MDDVRFLQLDVFTERAGGGNPLGVVFGTAGWSDRRRQSLARWLDLVETTFVLPPTQPGADYRVRIFTPVREIPFAGHPSVGTAHAVLTLGTATPRDGRLVQECGAGRLPLRIEGEAGNWRIAVQSPAAHGVRRAPDLDPSLGFILDGIATGPAPTALVEGGRRWWVVEFRDVAALRAWRAPHAAIGALARATDSLGIAAFAREHGESPALVVRAFPCGVGIDEDPASGAANGLIASWLRELEPAGPLSRGYTVSQGREIGHDARLDVAIDADGTVWVGGRSHVVVDGRLAWPAVDPGAS
jgi:PhzF family phenazine biosynthesis protein